MTANWTECIGFVAAACTTFAFVPQLLKIRKQGGRDLSYPMLGIYLAGLCLWLAYGLRMHSPSIIFANAVSIILVVAAIAMKAIMGAREPQPAVHAALPPAATFPGGARPD